MDPSRSTILSFDNFPPNPQDAFMTYPSPISPPVELMHQFSIQNPTPLMSNSSSPMGLGPANEEDTTTVVSLSTVFHPGTHAVDPDTVFVTSDMVLFYVHSAVLKSASPHAFRRVLEVSQDLDQDTPIGAKQLGSDFSERLIRVPETSSVLNIILHVLYGTPSAQHSPSFETLATAVDRMPFYDLVPKRLVVPRTPLYDLLLTHAPVYPLQLYTLTGRHDLQDLAVATSSHLLSYPLANLPEEMAECMGALYLKKLLCLHLDRFNALKQILLSPPHPHPATRECSFTDQKKLTRAWALVAAYLAWDARPDLSTHSMRSAFQPLTENLSCKLCEEGLQKRIKDVIVQWASVKRTI